MSTLSLKICIDNSGQVKTIQFEPSMMVEDACLYIRQKIQEANRGNSQEYGLFLSDDDPKKGVWLDKSRTLEYYLLRNNDELDYKSKLRILRVRMLDGSVKTLQVDDSQNVGQLMIAVCSRIGITNHEEYSLIYEPPEEEREKMATLKKQSTIARNHKKLDSMKKKLHTDDELNWLDHNRTLREQNINDSDVLLLKRKLFFSDQNIDARDPIQLNLLYVQMRDAILNGAHPVTKEEAVQFAGLQCHIQFGAFVESKHKPGFLELKDFLPKEYVKEKGIEKKIFLEHKSVYSLSELEAKLRYTQLARSLKTYGITFFLVKEKMKGEKKLVPRLFGVTKESIVRVDERTKEIMKTWPLTHVRRWACSANSFNLDFGDHDTQYYSVQTTEGEAISALIAGYIDIIVKQSCINIMDSPPPLPQKKGSIKSKSTTLGRLFGKKKRDKDHFGIDGDEESTMLEESVTPAKATIIQHQSSTAGQASTGTLAMPGVLRNSQHGPQSFQVGSMGGAKYGMISNQSSHQHLPPSQSRGQNSALHAGLNQSQRALLGTISSAMSGVQNAQNDMDSQLDLSHLGNDAASRNWRENTFDISRENVSSHLSAVNSATAQIINLTSNSYDETDHAAVGSAVHTISSNMQGLTRDVKMLAALREAEGGSGRSLLDAARKMTSALSDLLNAAQPGSKEPRSALLGAATKVGEASSEILKSAGASDEANQSYNDMLMDLAKAVANATATLVLKSKAVASSTEDEALQNKVITTATQCALATSQLVSCTKISVSTIHNPACQEQVIEATKLVDKSVEAVVVVGQEACQDQRLLGDLGAAAQAVTKALNDLLNHIKNGGRVDDDAVDAILCATDKLFNSMGDAPEMVRQARSIAQVTSTLVNAINGQAQEQNDGDIRNRLTAAAQALAEATCKMVEAAKGCAGNPNDSRQQQSLKSAAEDLRSATNAAAQDALRKKQLLKLESAARQVCASATQLCNASEAAGSFNRNQPSQQDLSAQCSHVQELIPKLIAAVSNAKKNPESVQSVRLLIDASKAVLQPGGRVCMAAKAAIPTIGDKAAQLSVSNSTRQLGLALSELRNAVVRAEELCGSLHIEGALEQIKALDSELVDTRRGAESSSLVPLPGETAETCSVQLGSASKSVGACMASLLTAAAQGNEEYTCNAAIDVAHALKQLVTAVRGISATSSDKETNLALIDAARDVVDKSARLLEEASKALSDPNNKDNQTRLAQVAKAVSLSLNSCVNCLPGQRDIDNVLKSINSSQEMLSSDKFPPSDGRSYAELQDSLIGSASQLNEAATEMVTAARGTPQQLATTSRTYSTSYATFIQDGMTVAGANKDQEAQQLIVGGLKGVSVVSSKLLIAAKSLHSDPTAPNAKNLLAQAARSVTESINQLIDVCTTAAPGQKECDSALREIQAASTLLDTPNEPVNDNSYFQCLDTVIDKSKVLGQSMTGMTNYSKDGNMESFCVSVRHFSTSICALTESAAQSAYLVGIADKASEPGKPGLVDQSQFSRANQAIQQACQTLSSPTSSQSQVLSAATIIAKHTSALCNACRIASGKTNNPVAKRQFVQSAKDVANSTANLVKAIKVLDGDFTSTNKQFCAESAKPLIEAVEKLTTYGSSPEFASIPARISKEARRAQEPIIEAGRQMVESSCKMVMSAKKLVSAPKDPSVYQAFSTHSKSLSQAMKSLITSIKESSPGQRESDQAIDSLTSWVKDLDAAAFAAISQSLAPREDNSMQGFQEQVINSCKQIIANIDPLTAAASSEAEKLGHRVTLISNYFDPLTDSAIGCASKMHNIKQQSLVLEQTKSVAEAGLELVYCAKSSAGNPKATQSHEAMTQAASSLKELAQCLLLTMEEAASAGGAVTAMVDNLSKAMAKVDLESNDKKHNATFVDYQTSMVQQCRRIAQYSHEMVAKGSSPESCRELGHLANLLTKEYGQLAEQLQGAAAVCGNPEVAARLKSRVQDLGNSCVRLVQNAGTVQMNPTDSYSRRELAESSKDISEKVSYVLAALQDSSRGTQACINAASIVSGIIGDLDTTIMFATAGTLASEADKDSFTTHRESILKTAKLLVDDTKTLVAGATGTQESLANAAQHSVKTIASLADVVKLGAASIGSDQPEAQVLLINAVKDVASALSDLISCTKNAAGKPNTDPAMISLKESAKVMVTNVTSLLKTVKTVEDEAERGTRALESTIEALRQEIKAFDSTEKVDKVATAEDLIRHTKPITTATAKAVAAGNSCRQEDVIAASNMGRKAVCDLLLICKAAVQNAENEDIKKRTLMSTKQTAENYLTLLLQIMEILQKPGQANLKAALRDLSKNVAQSVSELCRGAEALKGSDFVDPDDPTVIAENELLGAAKSIEAAAKKLMQLKPRETAKEANENLNFDEQILEACKSIAAATSALVKSATAAQRELVSQGRMSMSFNRYMPDEDGQWSQGLISAANMVAAATHSLCEAANAMVQGHASEEQLISSAKQVAGSTAQLLVACKVKADPDSIAMKRLQAAGNAVKRATEALVKAAQQVKEREDEANVQVNKNMVSGVAQLIDVQAEVLEKEKELQRARQKLAALRKAKYKDTDVEDSDRMF